MNATRPRNAYVRPALSLILCGRNDNYMGNSMWRLQTALCHVARELTRIGRNGQVEIIVADWGSIVPLAEAVELTADAASIVSFLCIPPETATVLQRDSPFAEVLALNAAARRARGDFIGRIDQDTLVGGRFLQTFFELYAGERTLFTPFDKALLFANLRTVPYRFGVRCPPFNVVEWFIASRGSRLAVAEPVPPIPFYAGAVGICMMHRSLWFESGGYDERMIYMNAMETNLARRLLMKYEAVNIGALDAHDFYHIEHYHPRAVRKTSTHRKVNPHLPFAEPDLLNPNGEDWGLINYEFPMRLSSAPRLIVQESRKRREIVRFLPALVAARFEMAGDALHSAGKKWLRRAGKAREKIAGKPVRVWASELRQLWIGRAHT